MRGLTVSGLGRPGPTSGHEFLCTKAEVAKCKETHMLVKQAVDKFEKEHAKWKSQKVQHDIDMKFNNKNKKKRNKNKNKKKKNKKEER